MFMKTKIAFLTAFFITVLFSVSAHAVTIDEANKVFNDYDKDITNIQKSITMYEQIISESKDNTIIFQAYIGESRAYETSGDQAKLTHTSPQNDYEQGMIAAQRAIKIDPNNAMGYYWYAGNIGRETEYKSLLDAVMVLPVFRKYMDKAYSLDKANADILEGFGEMYYELPWIVSGSNTKAIDFLTRSLKLDPNLTLSMVILGKVYIREDNYDQARQILMKVMNFKTPTYRADWVMYDKPLAQKLLDSIKDK